MVKVCIMINSPLLELSLKKWLKSSITTYKDCDIVISDKHVKVEKSLLVIGSKGGIVKPFSRSSLMLAIEKKAKSIKNVNKITVDTKLDLQKELKRLQNEYQTKVSQTIEKYLGNL